MSKWITTFLFVLMPMLSFGQMINDFDTELDPTYFGAENSDNADPALSNTTLSTVSPGHDSPGALQIDYSVHNSEGWGGYTKIYHYANPFGGDTGSPIEGTWMLAPIAGALGVGPVAGSTEWWSNSEEDVTTRACFFDDHYVFNADGSFQNVLGDETWLEAWQGVDADQCGAPVAPHDGSNAATWEYDEATGEVTLTGIGAYLGLPKAVNAGELPNVDVPESVTYSASMEGDMMTLVIECGTGVFWTFKLVAQVQDTPLSGTWMLAPEAGALQVGPSAGSGEWWSSSADDVTTRACFFDDQYVLNADGSFQNVLGDETWLEAWQGVDADQCGAPVAPHDGSNASTWEYDAATGHITLTGVGAYMGLPKAVNAGELPNVDVPESVTYSATMDGDMMTLVIECGTGVFWTFKLVSSQTALAAIGQNNDNYFSLLEMRPRDGEGPWDWSGYDSLSFSYNNTVAQCDNNGNCGDAAPGRVHLRLNLSDYGDIADPSNYTDLGEYYYSFHYLLDSEPGWNTVTLPLVRNDDWNGNGFNLTGWAGTTGNGELDKHAIGGFHFEFSVSGGGEGDYVTGTIILDNFTLTGSLNQLTNPGFELPDVQDDGMGWGSAIGGGHAEVVTDPAMAYSGDNYLSIGVTDNWAVFYTEDTIPAQFGETWRLSGFGKQVLGDNVEGAGAAFKLEGKDAAGNILGTSGDVFLPLTTEWEEHSIEFVMPEGVETVTAVVVASRWDGVEVDYAFDNMFLMSMGVLDVIPPVAVEDIGAVPASYYNLVTWSDIAGEEGETYHVYASTSPITDVTDPSVDVVATNVLEGSQAAVHYLFHPLEDTDVTYYYAVACKDASNNVGPAGASESSITNGAKGVPTISLNPPTAFAADGDLTEWYDSGIEPFMIGATENSYGTPNVGMGTVDDDNDLHGTFYVAVDNDYLYIAAEVLDNVVNNDQSGGWWTSDVVQVCLGLYDQRGAKHVGMQRGEEPDYKMYFLPDGAYSDNGAGMLAEHADGNYFHEVFNPDYVFEFRISLDDILIDDDVRLTPANGMRTPFEPMIHDNDGDGWEGQLVLSATNDDMAHQTCEVWSNTWIGDQATMVSTDEDIVVNEFALHQNYPNPFNPQTTIKFSLPESQLVNLSVYNMLGQQVMTLVDRELPAGYHTAKWYAGDIASGVYIYKLTSGNKSLTQKMLLMK